MPPLPDEPVPLEPLARYRREGGVVFVELALRTPRQLFDDRDPAPFRARDLDDDAVQWILDAVEEIPRGVVVTFLLHFDERSDDANFSEAAIRDAIRAHFRYLVWVNRRAARSQLQNGLWSLLFALGVLAVCMGAESALRPLVATKPWAAVFREGVVILGWVALWRPFETLLFSWWPFATRARLLRRVLRAEVKVRPSSRPDGASIPAAEGATTDAR